jgi:superfamily I DNA/RNA helicase
MFDSLAKKLENFLDEYELERLSNQDYWEQQVVVSTPQKAKGLEFDAVLLFEPIDFYVDSLYNSKSLADSNVFVAITRPTQKLVIVYSDKLPKGL